MVLRSAQSRRQPGPPRSRRSCLALLLAIAASWVAATDVHAQDTGSISGRVTEAGGATVVAAQVSLDGGQRGTLTNDLGTFRLSDVPAGTHTLSVVRIGYATFEAEVSVTAGSTAGVEVVLESTAVPLAALTVIGSREELDETRREMRQIPGAVALLEPAAIRQTRQATFADVLRLTPGVFAQPRFGAADETQLSIRGSGLRNNFHLRGVNILVNGMPYRLADGFTDFETLEMLNTESIQVYKGGNALRWGGSTLGGAINFESKTGHTAQPLEVYAQAGSYGFTKAQISSGNVFGDFNYWFANVKEDLPGALNQADLTTNRTAAHPNNVADQYGRDYKLHHVGVQLRTQLAEGARLDVAPFFQYRDIVHAIFRVLDQVSHDVGVEARYRDERQVGGHDSGFSLGVQWAWGKNQNRH
ncbi:MAG TPA: TonB-dependent receptor plug domain-containing protein, partial [Longimicrobiales bacterium]|nr:TonB-dependent receptor plug domain-containing protein [Longimicrobiales bacterium]